MARKIFLLVLLLLVFFIWSCTVTPVPNLPPNTPSNPNPANGATGVDVDITLSWSCSDPDGDALTYDIYFGTSSNPPLVKSNHTSTTYNLGTLDYGTTYYWKVVAKDSKGGTTSSPVWSFTTTTGESAVLIAWTEDKSLDEDYYYYWSPITITTTGEVYGWLHLTHWDGDYGLEILLMTASDFADFQSGGAYAAWHKSVFEEGWHYFCFSNVTPGNYVLIVDNTDEGWETTDFDFENDYAVFDLEAYFEAY